MLTSTATPTSTPTPPPLLGDANCDGQVNAADLPAEVALVGQHEALPCGADLNGDLIVDEQDLSLLADVLFRQ